MSLSIVLGKDTEAQRNKIAFRAKQLTTKMTESLFKTSLVSLQTWSLSTIPSYQSQDTMCVLYF